MEHVVGPHRVIVEVDVAIVVVPVTRQPEIVAQVVEQAEVGTGELEIDGSAVQRIVQSLAVCVWVQDVDSVER